MPLLLRKIRKSKWYKSLNVPWLPPGELQADALGNLKTENNKLSLWHIEDNSSNLNQVLIAVLTTLDVPSNIDIALIDSNLVSDIGINMESTKGNTKISNVNINWHRNLIELTANKLMQLAQIIMQHASFKRFSEDEALSLAQKTIDAGTINKTLFKKTFQEYLS